MSDVEVNWQAQLELLGAPTPREHIQKDPKGNDHVTARYVMNLLDSVVGPANWSDSYRVVSNIQRPDGTARISVECSLTVYGITKTDVGYGEILYSSNNNKLYGEYEKEAYSIALKRAGVKFGIARDLYGDGLPDYVEDAPQRTQSGQKAAPERAGAPEGGVPTGERISGVTDFYALAKRELDMSQKDVNKVLAPHVAGYCAEYNQTLDEAWDALMAGVS